MTDYACVFCGRPLERPWWKKMFMSRMCYGQAMESCKEIFIGGILKEKLRGAE